MRELQLFTITKHRWEGNRFEAETRYSPSVYVAKLSVDLHQSLDDDDKENLAQTLLRILEEKMKAEFKRFLEDTEENHGFLETKVLMKLSDKLARETERSLQRFHARWETAID